MRGGERRGAFAGFGAFTGLASLLGFAASVGFDAFGGGTFPFAALAAGEMTAGAFFEMGALPFGSGFAGFLEGMSEPVGGGRLPQ